jgi:hypothetical protein
MGCDADRHRDPMLIQTRNEYHLTEKGLGLRVILVALRQWGEDNLFDDGEPTTVMVDKANGDPIGRLRLTARDGRVISPLAACRS